MPKTITLEGNTITVPDTMQWIAQDEDGAWWAYQTEPLQHRHGWYENEVGAYVRLPTAPSGGDRGGGDRDRVDWKTTLQRI